MPAPVKLLIEYSGNGNEDWEATWDLIGSDHHLNRYERTKAAFVSGGDSAIESLSEQLVDVMKDNDRLKQLLVISTTLNDMAADVLEGRLMNG